MGSSLITAAVGLGSSIGGALSGGGSSSGGSNGSNRIYTPSGTQLNFIDSSLVNSLGTGAGLGQAAAQTPYFDGLANSTQALGSNPYYGGYLTGSQYGGGMGQQAAQNQFGYANQLGMLAGQQGQFSNAALPYAQQELISAFDPQTALYNQTANNTMQQLNATNSMNGVAGSPYGAGLASQGLNNFNINWQNNQLSRETQGIDAYTKALNGANQSLGAVGSGYSTAAGLGTGASTNYLDASAQPYNAYNTAWGNQFSAYNNYFSGVSNAVNAVNAGSNPMLQYLGYGVNSQQPSAANNQKLASGYASGIASSLNSLGNNKYVKSIGNSIYSGLSNLFGGSSGGGSSGYASIYGG